MTKILMKGGDGRLMIHMEGHAGFGAYGADPVCAGLSALAYTGARMLEELDVEGRLADPPLIRMEPGLAHLEARALPEGKEVLGNLGRFMRGGFRLMAMSFPTAVELDERSK